MPADIDMENAAERHYHDAVRLLNAHRYDNAGYHFGFAAECAVKALMKRARIPERARVTFDGEDRRGAYFEHFPDLKAAVVQEADGRIGARLLAMVEHPGFLQGWSVKMRYLRTGTVTRDLSEKWRDHADALLAELNR